MSASGITLRAIIAHLFGLKPEEPPAHAASPNAERTPYSSDEQLTVPGYYVAEAPAGPLASPEREAREEHEERQRATSSADH